jgi:hypothetical protein
MKKLNCSPEYKTGSTRNPATTKRSSSRSEMHNKTVKADADTIRHVQGRLRRPENENAKVRVRQGRLLAANPLLQGAGVSGLGRVRTPPPRRMG